MSDHRTHEAGVGGLDQTSDATAQAASELTELTRRWLTANANLDAQRHADITLATYEALSNCVDHAYRDHEDPGRMTLQVHRDPVGASIRICVTDQGRWVTSTPTTTTAGVRGRGLILMRALADDLSIDGRDEGTTVCLHFRDHLGNPHQTHRGRE